MKSLLRGIVINSFSLWATSQLINGLVIKGGVDVVLLGGVTLTLINLLVKPVISLLTLPLNLITLGIFSWLINVFMLYLLTVFVPQISFASYTFPGLHNNGFSLPLYTFPTLQTVILIAFVLSFTINFINWLFRQ